MKKSVAGRLPDNSSLDQGHWEHLRSEGFTDAQITKMVEQFGVRSLSQAEALKQGFKVWDGEQWQSSEGLLLPFTTSFAQLRCNTPLERQNGKAAKYLTPIAKPSQAFAPKGCKAITEGVKDALAGTLHGGIPTGAIAGVSHYRKALPKGCGYTIIFDADGWQNSQVFANLLHAGKWCSGRVTLLPEIKDQPKAGLVEYFKEGKTSEDYQRLVDGALKPEDLLQEWPDHWHGIEPYRVVKLARTAAALSALYLSSEDGAAFIRRMATQHSKTGLRARELAAFAKKWRDRHQKIQSLTTYQREHRLILNRFGKRLTFNELTQQPELDKVPFKPEKVRAVLSVGHGLPLRSGREDLIDSIVMIAQQRSYHPVRQYLEQVAAHWNGKIAEKSKLDSLASDFLGNVDPTAQKLLKKTLIAAVARVFNPGCKVDTATVLAGPQGHGKSQFWKTLTSPDWFCDDFSDVDNKDHLLKLHEAWIIEWPELHGLSRKEVTRVKSFMTTARDRIRRPYAREAEWMRRPSILVGSSNDKEFLTDSSGNRRWWIIEVTQKIDIKKLTHERDEVWAAAVAAYQASEPWWLTEDEERAAEDTRKQYEAVDAWHDAIADYVESRQRVSIAELFDQVLKIETGRQDNAGRNRVSNVLRRLGWESAPNAVQHLNKRQRVWERKNISVLGGNKTDVSDVPGVSDSQNPGIESNIGQHTPDTHPAVSGVSAAHLQHTSSTLTHPAVSDSVPSEPYVQTELQSLDTSDTPDTPLLCTPKNKMFSLGDRVKKKGKTGWAGTVKKLHPCGKNADVLWDASRTAVMETLQKLEVMK